MCSLCNKYPESIYHIILLCEFTNKLWEDIAPILRQIHPLPISEEEKAFGIVQKNMTIGIILRNWLTYLLRECIMQEERKAHYAPNKTNVEKTKEKFNQNIIFEIKKKFIRYKNENNLPFFDKMMTHAGVLCNQIEDGEYDVWKVFP